MKSLRKDTLHARIQEFSSGGSWSIWQKSSDVFVFLVLSLFYKIKVKWLISKKTIIFQGSGGGPTFSRGGGVQLLIPFRNPYNLWFSRGVRPPPPPLGSALALVMKHPLEIMENSMPTQKDEADLLNGYKHKRTRATVYISCNVWH